MGQLILLRHGNSVWNQKNIFTGWADVPLSRKGVEEATDAGKLLSKIKFDKIYTSKLVRAQMTLQLLMLENEDERDIFFAHDDNIWYDQGIDSDLGLKVTVSEALNERFYGDLQGKEKNAYKKEVGDELFKEYRRSYKTPPPNGESLEMTIERTLPYFDKVILPHVKTGETVLIVAHGNSLRGILKEILEISEEDIIHHEIATGSPLIYSYENAKFKEAKI